MASFRDQVFSVVREIPAGRVAGYGQVGRALDAPISGLLVGKILATCPPDVPWWRVVGADGSLLVAKRDPRLALEQRDRLESEGARFAADRVSREHFLDEL